VKLAGVEYDIVWQKFRRGTSLFFPCLDPQKAREELGVVLKRLNIKVVVKTTIQEGVKGIRVWRV